ncbi:MAG: hypothetical protein WC816_14165 [Sphingomonas sp.]|jgi:hypothetical protein
MIVSLFKILHGISGTFKLLAGTLLLVGLSACDPSYSVVWSKNFDKPIQVSCISTALQSLAKTVSQGSYVSDGDRGFPRGTIVTQFGYSDPYGEGHFDYDIGKIDAFHTRIHHSFDKVGNRPSDEYLRRSVELLTRNNKAVAAMCGLTFSPDDFQKS